MRKTALRRNSKSPRKKIVKLLDDVVSEIVRIKEPYCVVCGSTEKLGNGHLFSRTSYSTRWDISEDGNCHTQCWPCNYRHVKEKYPYERWYQNKFGMKKYDELWVRYRTTRPYKQHELEELYEDLKLLLLSLKDA